MSKAFTKESDSDGATEIPDREISPVPNLVTPEGLSQIDAAIDTHSAAHASALAAADKESAARSARELRYWTARRASAQVQPPPSGSEEVTFGAAVDLLRSDGRHVSYRIVGEEIAAGATEATITAISI